jgi:hypothetical protein
MGFLFRLLVIGLIIYFLWSLVCGGYNAVMSFFWWMRP